MKSKKTFEKYLRSIGGLENGWSAYPNRRYYPIRSRLFLIFESLGCVDDKNPFRSKIYSRGYFSVGDGWLELLQNCIEELVRAGWDKKVTQVKEKFGGLRFYTGPMDDECHKIVKKYENLSYQICEVCGKSGAINKSNGWYRTLCEKHVIELNNTEEKWNFIPK